MEVAILAAGVFSRGLWAEAAIVPSIKAQAFPEKELFQGKKLGTVMVRWIPENSEILANINGTLEVINPDKGSREVLMEGLPISGVGDVLYKSLA